MSRLASRRPRSPALIGITAVLASLFGAGWSPVVAASPSTVVAWNKIAEDTVVGSGSFQNEGWIYLSYTELAVYDAVVAIDGRYEAYAAPLAASAGADVNAAVIQAAYDTLLHYFPNASVSLTASYTTWIGGIANSQAKTDGIAVGDAAAAQIIAERTGDGRLTPIGTSSAFPTQAPGPGVWRLTPAAFAAPQTPWVGQVTTFVVPTPDRFAPPAPPALDSPEWVAAYNEIKSVGQNTSTTRTAAQTATAWFYQANVNRQFNRAVRELSASRNLDLVETARLAAMVNVVAADAGISSMNAKYRDLFWRPVTAIDPSAVTADGYGPVPGFDDGNPLTVPQPGWRPLLATPNHPEYPSAHCTLTSAMTEVFAQFFGTNWIDLTLHGFDPKGAPGNFDATIHFARANDLRASVIDARVWAGLHYRFSDVAGSAMGRSIAKYDLRHAFQPLP
jgi:vanadium-dependent haloperoxidase-like protein